MKTAELTGRKLDEWVARAAGHYVAFYTSENGGNVLACTFGGRTYIIDGGTAQEWLCSGVFHPSTDWATGGPLIEQAQLDIEFYDVKEWGARRREGIRGNEYGPTPLIAAMRAYVASKIGDKVPDDPALP